MLDWVVFLTYKFFKVLVKITPKVLMKYFLVVISRFVYLLETKYNKIARVNLDLAFGDTKTKKQKESIIKASYDNLFFNLYEFIDNQGLTLEELEKKIDVENEDIMLDALKSKRKIILITAHYGNWEIVNTYNSAKYKPMTVVGRPLNNKLLNDELRETRNLHNSQMLDKNNAAKGLVKALKDDRMIALVVDQDIDEIKGEEIEFFGQAARQTESSTKLAKKFDALIIPVFVVKNDFCNYTMKFCKPVEANTQVQADIIEEQIRKKPEDWFWQHRRFKQFHKSLYLG